jgi:hypothetical protein
LPEFPKTGRPLGAELTEFLLYASTSWPPDCPVLLTAVRPSSECSEKWIGQEAQITPIETNTYTCMPKPIQVTPQVPS